MISSQGHQNIVDLFAGGGDLSSHQKVNSKYRDLVLIEFVLKWDFCVSEYIERVCEGYTVHGPDDFIINGRPAKPEEFPWMVCR